VTILESGLRHVRADLEALPPGVQGALVAVATKDGIRAGVVTRLPDGWQVSADLGVVFEGRKLDARATVIKTW
jgi:hypothetical protein